MGRAKAQLRYWPDGSAPMNYPAELTVAAKRVAASALEELNRLGVSVRLDKAGRANFRAAKVLPPAAKRMIEIHGDLIEAYLLTEQDRIGNDHG
jgi:hypothetical protein